MTYHEDKEMVHASFRNYTTRACIPKRCARERDKTKKSAASGILSPEVIFMPRKDPGMPYDLAPMLKARFGQPDDCADLVNKYGTYNIQPTSDTENLFPLIAPGLPEQWKRMAVGKKDVENLQ